MELYKRAHTPEALIKDVSLSSKRVTGYFASFDNKDSDGDVFLKGCFNKSIKENGPDSRLKRIAYLNQHMVYEPLGPIEVLKETNEGLYFESKITPTTYGENTLKLYADGVLKEHSVGVSLIKDNYENGANLVTEAKLWEGSVVTWGANEETPFTGFKTLTKDQAIDRLDKMLKAFKNGTYTDDTFYLLEIGIEQIKSHISSLEKPEPTPTLKEPTASELINIFKNSLTI